MANAYTATTIIGASPERVFDYVRVAENQVHWAINFVRATRPVGDGCFVMETPFGDVTLSGRRRSGAIRG